MVKLTVDWDCTALDCTIMRGSLGTTETSKESPID